MSLASQEAFVSIKKRKILVLDLVTNGPTRSLYSRLMNANLTGIMAQAVAVWCEELGHDVRYSFYTGSEDLLEQISDDLDMLIVGAFTRSAQLAYAIANVARQKGIVTVLGGPHPRCYPEDSAQYFDYVLGFTDRALISGILADCSQQTEGVCLSAPAQPRELPPIGQRWKYVEQTLAKAPPGLKFVPMISSLGCPYQCSFCIDSTVPYQPLSRDQLSEDLEFIGARLPRAIIGWHDPNFGVRFDEYLGTIENTAGARTLRHVAESSLSLLSEANVTRMAKANFAGLLPGIESWFALGNKSKTGNRQGMEKVRELAEQVNMILAQVPFVQTNFVLGLDSDEGPEPFELTKRFIDLCPGAFPAYSQRTAFGEATPENLDLQRAGRVLAFPHHLLDNNLVMNVVPRNYSWSQFYRHMHDMTAYSFSRKAVFRRLIATKGVPARVLNFARAVSNEGAGRIRHYAAMLDKIENDAQVRGYLAQESEAVPDIYTDKIRNDLGRFWDFLPPGAMEHDAYSYLHKSEAMHRPAASITAHAP